MEFTQTIIPPLLLRKQKCVLDTDSQTIFVCHGTGPMQELSFQQLDSVYIAEVGQERILFFKRYDITFEGGGKSLTVYNMSTHSKDSLKRILQQYTHATIDDTKNIAAMYIAGWFRVLEDAPMPHKVRSSVVDRVIINALLVGLFVTVYILFFTEIGHQFVGI